MKLQSLTQNGKEKKKPKEKKRKKKKLENKSGNIYRLPTVPKVDATFIVSYLTKRHALGLRTKRNS